MSDRLSSFCGVNILVVGDVMLDYYQWCEVTRISPEAPVPVVRVRDKTSVLGGAANVAANLAGLGCKTVLLGARGDDEAGRVLAHHLRSAGIEDKLLIEPHRPTTTKTRVLAQGQQLIRLDEEEIGILSAAAAEELFSRYRALLPGKRAVILSDYGKGVLSGALCRDMIGHAGARNVAVLVDPKGKDWDRYRHATCITPNESELEAVLGGPGKSEQDLLTGAIKVQKELCLDHLLVTRGAKGMILVRRDGEPAVIAAKPREVFDVSGAGDTVIAVLAAGVAAGLSWSNAARVANAAAGAVVGKVGTHAISMDELQVALRLDEIGSLHKIFNLDDAKMQVDAWRVLGERVVFTNGCFDLLHVGHIKLLQAAAKEGSKLVVGLNSDASVGRLKGVGRPILRQQDRASILAALECVDMVVIFDEDTPLNLIQVLRPEVLVKGADYVRTGVVGHQLVEAWGGQVVLVPLAAGSSTTNIVKMIQKNSSLH
ncbi:bifunctional D-glycero-beta-D-manno-heptose-7-phosphate kinase/D-glycero-beta-D-manno-heptose 1-phosphate adenylyltransferase HldE [Desulfoferrobacter suflitae]|uniref:bifunctional D-glycero-beta-D-manno-heptose-7-phosphate kinase/D-glycero-beta-D-manno-heptose 1-phosphate adenylyltransferase HldE n=1 Tax=Desulfoferrobacter suflitae TaxID=2865782 RepID=UPI002164D562|nr:bifunctional D-glycero-beta-D-manno-heptose-7-phosphate kinase/D-glycero-beta-D-manno-heptose 1-phosphate adenylyltransferase HldE [Desulfoferrobacter suflitae]MCK8603497.1 bifunctional D-glycero-beta-D-manno-heptose-7-phosphate kinase/D-glycero-beta-D-manno-heptose 1-phosphate adenylyltransferase HldE [Desulfoferrobacter suflitae]